MKSKKIILVILSFAVVVVSALVLGKYFTDLLHEMMIGQDPGNQFNSGGVTEFNWRIYVQLFFVLFAAVCCPFIFSALSFSINKQNWWKLILILECTGVLLVFITAPPDLISRIIIFIAWQLPVLINFITLRLMIRKKSIHSS